MVKLHSVTLISVNIVHLVSITLYMRLIYTCTFTSNVRILFVTYLYCIVYGKIVNSDSCSRIASDGQKYNT